MRGVVAVVLAAGIGRRFGGTKQLAVVGGQPLVTHAVDAARAADIGRILVVVGHDADAVRAAVDGDGVTIVANPEYTSGQASSLRAGLAAIADDNDDDTTEMAVVLLADQPRIEPARIRAVVDAAAGHEAARTVYQGRPGHPVALTRALWPRLLEQVDGDVGARDVLADGSTDMVDVVVAEPAPPDVDTAADLARVLDASPPGIAGGEGSTGD